MASNCALAKTIWPQTTTERRNYRRQNEAMKHNARTLSYDQSTAHTICSHELDPEHILSTNLFESTVGMCAVFNVKTITPRPYSVWPSSLIRRLHLIAQVNCANTIPGDGIVR